MTQEDKELLFQDLCCRLPYGVKVNISASRPDRYDNFVKSINDATINSIDLNIEICKFKEFWWDSYIVNVRPYLRPMSSMTEEEAKEIAILHDIKDILSVKVTSDYIDVTVDDGVCSTERRTIWYDEIVSSVKCFNFLTAHHFDYRGLIEKGLALEAPEGMYNIKEK